MVHSVTLILKSVSLSNQSLNLFSHRKALSIHLPYSMAVSPTASVQTHAITLYSKTSSGYRIILYFHNTAWHIIFTTSSVP